MIERESARGHWGAGQKILRFWCFLSLQWSRCGGPGIFLVLMCPLEAGRSGSHLLRVHPAPAALRPPPLHPRFVPLNSFCSSHARSDVNMRMTPSSSGSSSTSGASSASPASTVPVPKPFWSSYARSEVDMVRKCKQTSFLEIVCKNKNRF